MYLQVGTEDEDGLIGRCLEGDSAAFEPLVERYHGPLFRVAARLLGDREEARDATQTAFLKAYQALATCDRQRKFFSWIYRILVNDCLNTLRARRPMQGLDGTMAAPAERTDAVESAETRGRVRRALLQLTPDQRDVIVLQALCRDAIRADGGGAGDPRENGQVPVVQCTPATVRAAGG